MREPATINTIPPVMSRTALANRSMVMSRMPRVTSMGRPNSHFAQSPIPWRVLIRASAHVVVYLMYDAEEPERPWLLRPSAQLVSTCNVWRIPTAPGFRPAGYSSLQAITPKRSITNKLRSATPSASLKMP